VVCGKRHDMRTEKSNHSHIRRRDQRHLLSVISSAHAEAQRGFALMKARGEGVAQRVQTSYPI
jgi:hypothetical protein